MRLYRQSIALLLSWCLVLVGARGGFAYQESAAISQEPPQAAQQTPEQLQQLVAPIALYPDALIAQILPAATYPAEVVAAQQWMRDPGDGAGGSIPPLAFHRRWPPMPGIPGEEPRRNPHRSALVFLFERDSQS